MKMNYQHCEETLRARADAARSGFGAALKRLESGEQRHLCSSARQMGCLGSKELQEPPVVFTSTSAPPLPSSALVQVQQQVEPFVDKPPSAAEAAPPVAEGEGEGEEEEEAQRSFRCSTSDTWWAGKMDEQQQRLSQRQKEDGEEDQRLSAAAAAPQADDSPPPRRASRVSRSSSSGGAKAKHQTTSQLRALLRQRGIDIPEEATRAALEALVADSTPLEEAATAEPDTELV